MLLAKRQFISSEDQPFDVFGLGQRALSGEAWDEWEDRVRFFTEECDLMQVGACSVSQAGSGV